MWTSFPAGMSAIAKELALGAIAQTLLSDPIRLELSNAIACVENARRHASGFLSATKRSILNTPISTMSYVTFLRKSWRSASMQYKNRAFGKS